ncbi:MAG: hypothetical protein HRU70_00695 [Phycisphaeraceae bacterium]|nr:MAG: hypothetical protein HRU70_00695 [Phycisphaeraceae bacterium]
MRSNTARAILAVSASALATITLADPPYELNWTTIDGGGGTMSGGIYTMSVTIGQHDAGQPMTGGIYSLSGGFWAGGTGEPSCPADFNDDGFVDFFDLDAYVECFEGGECPPGKSADFNDDGFVDFFDLDAFVEAFEVGC